MAAQVRQHRLTFRTAHLEAVRKGEKCCTVRFSAAAARIREGDRLTLAFGRYDRPTCLESTVRQVVTLDLEDSLERCFTLPEWVQSLADERRFYATPLGRPDGATEPELVEALQASGGDFESLMLEAAEKGVSTCRAVYWTLLG